MSVALAEVIDSMQNEGDFPRSRSRC